jgi:hypothetical protein
MIDDWLAGWLAGCVGSLLQFIWLQSNPCHHNDYVVDGMESVEAYKTCFTLRYTT